MGIIKRKPDIHPMAGIVLINPEPLDEVTNSGIILIEKANPKKVQRAAVVKVGKPLPGVPPQVKYMDTILFHRGTGIDVEFEGHEYKLIRQDHIAAIL